MDALDDDSLHERTRGDLSRSVHVIEHDNGVDDANGAVGGSAIDDDDYDAPGPDER